MRRLLAIIAFLVTGCTLWANGDPVATFCALTLSRNPIGVHVPEVQLKDEHLTVTPLGRYTLVRVEYLLYNNSKKDFVNLPKQLRATAPVDFTWQGLTDAAEIIHISDYYGNKPVTELYFAIAAVVKGNRNSDISVSEIVLLGE